MGVRRGRRTQIGGQFAPRLIEMLESWAYRVLSLSARRVLDRIEIELGHHGGNDNGRLPVTYIDFVSYGIERHAIGPAIREAVALGFLEVTERGCAGNAEFRSPNLFRLTFRPVKGDVEYGSNEWRRIASKEKALKLSKAARNESSTRAYRPSKRRDGGVARGGRKQNASAGTPHISVGRPHTESDDAPVLESRTTPKVGNPARLSISRGGSRSAPVGSAVASEPPRADADRAKAIDMIVRSCRCSRAEASDILQSLPNAPPQSGCE
jgi:hypothetical protein